MTYRLIDLLPENTSLSFCYVCERLNYSMCKWYSDLRNDKWANHTSWHSIKSNLCAVHVKIAMEHAILDENSLTFSIHFRLLIRFLPYFFVQERTLGALDNHQLWDEQDLSRNTVGRSLESKVSIKWYHKTLWKVKNRQFFSTRVKK